MKCKDCEHFRKIANTEECGEGICFYTSGATPVKWEEECIFNPKPYTCADCSRFNNDFACMTAEATDLIETEHGVCGGFIDKNESSIYKALYDWKLRGFNYREKIYKILDDFDLNIELPFNDN